MSASRSSFDDQCMKRALALAEGGQGSVEPNPMVGCVVACGDEVVGEGWHERFGGPHAEVNALRAAGTAARGAAMYVTLEPCCHQGKTPPCVNAILDAGIERVVVAMRDPFPQVDGGGIRQLQDAGIQVETGSCEAEARDLNAPYLKLREQQRPWVIAKWAMTLDGKIATASGDSQWISCEQSRAVVHQLRGRVDAIIVGRGTAVTDDPMLTARPPGPRVATRIIVDSQAQVSLDSKLVSTASLAPVLVACASAAPAENQKRLQDAGCEVFVCDGESYAARIGNLLAELGRRQMTNVLVEGGAALLGGLFDTGQIDEVHAFIAPKLIGGSSAPGPIAGVGRTTIALAPSLISVQIKPIDNDVYVTGRVSHGP